MSAAPKLTDGTPFTVYRYLPFTDIYRLPIFTVYRYFILKIIIKSLKTHRVWTLNHDSGSFCQGASFWRGPGPLQHRFWWVVDEIIFRQIDNSLNKYICPIFFLVIYHAYLSSLHFQKAPGVENLKVKVKSKMFLESDINRLILFSITPFNLVLNNDSICSRAKRHDDDNFLG